jgi:peptidoglycan/xylan/chitin deacetylase (PgdA/CDA1 family)
VALTFDDGPDRLTHEYLDVLDELGVRATFFVVGNSAVKEPELIREYVKRGHQIAAHGWDHTRFTKLRWKAIQEQVVRTNEVLPQTTSRPWVRPPYGSFDARVLAAILASGSLMAMWSFDSKDYEITDPQALTTRCTNGEIKPGDVILLHEGQQWTLDALPRIVKGLRDAGYELVTMADLVDG